ncbi:MAG: MBL fold metallo-hydrolase [Patescibacteria group bacterium]
MIITYLGKQFFKIQQGDLVMAFNPISKDSKGSVAPSRFGSAIALSTINHPDYNGFEMVTHGDTVPFSISGPGDYEIKDIFVKGIMTETEIKGKKYINTIYSLSIEGISLCFLGAVSGKLSTDVVGQIESPDILFVPIGNDDLLSPSEAYKLAVSLEPKVIIPMEYLPTGQAGDEKMLKAFLKEGGQEKVTPIEKLTIKAKELAGREGEIVVLSF